MSRFRYTSASLMSSSFSAGNFRSTSGLDGNRLTWKTPQRVGAIEAANPEVVDGTT